MAIFPAFNAFWHITIHKIFTNTYTCFSSLRKCLFSYVHASMSYDQTVSLCQSPITLSKPRNYEKHFLLKFFFIIS